MKKRSRIKVSKIKIGEKIVDFPKPFYVQKGYDDKLEVDVVFNLAQKWVKSDKQLKKYKEFTEIILKHLKNNGWSNDFTIDFWNMNEKELNVIHKFMNKYKEKK